jgi:hypothetical protein
VQAVQVSRVYGDHYGAEWVAASWHKAGGVQYETAELNASMIYLESLPLWTRGHVEIPDHAVLVRELRLLERIPGRVGRDQVTHPRGAHDDLANVVAGALWRATAGQSNEWMRPENLRRVTEECRMRAPYRRPLDSGLGTTGANFWGERRYGQMLRMRQRRY